MTGISILHSDLGIPPSAISTKSIMSNKENHSKINNVVIAGGTHGNELIGIYLVKKFIRLPDFIQKSSFSTFSFLANPKAIELCVRYIDKDLNRCFLKQDLKNKSPELYEEKRAIEINQMIGPKGNPKTDFIIDIHTTTSNMGITLIVANDSVVNMNIATYICMLNPNVRVFRYSSFDQDKPFLSSICELGFALEVGPVAQGAVDSNIFFQAEDVILSILDCIENINLNGLSHLYKAVSGKSLNYYEYLGKIDYPRDQTGDIAAMIHPNLIGNDYSELRAKDPIFVGFENQTFEYDGDSSVFPVFIGEVAYYEKDIAMFLTNKKTLRF